jgi:HlyD family secretion protein
MSRRRARQAGWTAIVLALAGLSLGAYYARRAAAADAQVVTQRVARGDLVEAVSSTGTLESVATVLVGSQVSGTVQALYADFNSIVRKGQLIASLEPSLFQSQVEQSRANLTRAVAELERAKVVVADLETKLARTGELWDRQLVPRTDLENAEVSLKGAQAQVKSAAAQVEQARASLTQAEVNLEKTRVFAPIDGIVVSRDVDVGQTVAASMQAPTLFSIAADLTRMRVNAGVDESDIGRIAEGQDVRFRVDAFPNEEFEGVVSQVRLQPIVQQNVVTYGVMIGVVNGERKLRPGMTATVAIEVVRRDDVLRVPNGALRFRPSAAALEALSDAAGADGSGHAEDTAREPAGPPAQAGSRVWVMDGGRLKAVRVRIGATDGVNTELVAGLAEGAEVVTEIKSGAKTSAAPSTTPQRSPLLQQGPMGPPPR